MAFLRSVPRCCAGSKYARNPPLPLALFENIVRPASQLFQIAEKSDYDSAARYSTGAAVAGGGGEPTKPVPRQIDPLDLKFNDPIASFKSKTTMELVRAYIVYQLCSVNYIVENNMMVSTFLPIDLPGASSLADCTCNYAARRLSHSSLFQINRNNSKALNTSMKHVTLLSIL